MFSFTQYCTPIFFVAFKCNILKKSDKHAISCFGAFHKFTETQVVKYFCDIESYMQTFLMIPIHETLSGVRK